MFQNENDDLHAAQIESVLKELKERLSDVSRQHDAVIRNSNHIIQEIERMSSNLLAHYSQENDKKLTNSSSDEMEEEQAPSTSAMNVKKLVKNFETIKINLANSSPPPAKINIEKSLDMGKILKKFEELNESIKMGDLAFQRAREQLQNVGEVFNEQCSDAVSAQYDTEYESDEENFGYSGDKDEETD